MTRDLLEKILADRSEFTRDGDAFSANEDTAVDLLYATGSAPVPISRISRIEVGAAYLTLDAESASYCVAYEHVVGLKLTHRKESSRTGFLR